MVAVASLKGTLMSPSVTPFAAALGAEVTGIDLRQPLEAAASRRSVLHSTSRLTIEGQAMQF